MQMELLLLTDVEHLGRSGDLVKVKPGFARNFLVPRKKAIIASPFVLRLRDKLVEERQKQAIVDRKEAEELVARMEGQAFETIVKVDPEGHLYGSVSGADVADILVQGGFPVLKSQVVLARPIKTIGTYTIQLKLKEGVTTSFVLHVNSDRPMQQRTEIDSSVSEETV